MNAVLEQGTTSAVAAQDGAAERAWTRTALIVAVSVNAALLLIYLLFTLRMVFDSDTGAKNIIAVEILEQGRLFPQGFGFWNDLWIVHGHLALLVLIPLLGNNVLANGLSSVLFAALFLPFVYVFLRRLDVGREAALLTTLVVGCGFSEEWAAFMYGQAAYGYVCLPLLATLYVVTTSVLTPGATRAQLALLIAIACWIGMLGGRGLLTFAVPSAASLLFLRVTGGARSITRQPVVLAAAGLVTGLIVREWVTSHITFREFGSAWLRQDELSLHGLWQATMALFALLPPQSIPTQSAWGVVFPMRLLFVACLTALVVAGSRLDRRASDSRRFVVLFGWLCAAVTIYLSLTVRILSGRGRYLIPPTFAFILIAAFALDRMAAWSQRRRLFALASVPLLGLSFVAYVAPLIPLNAGGVPWQQSYGFVRRLDALTESLGRMGIRRVYMSYASSTALTVLSGASVVARQIQFVEGLPTPHPLLSHNRWYAEEHEEPTALVVDLADPDDRGFSLDRLGRVLGPPLGTDERSRFLIVRYPRNVFPRLPEWQKRNLQLGLVSRLRMGPTAVQSIPGTGRHENGQLVSVGQPGFLVFGPYAQLPEGVYRVRLKLIVQGGTGSPGSWDIISSNPPVTFARGALPDEPAERPVTIEQTVRIGPDQTDLRIEARVDLSGKGSVRFLETEIERVP